MPRAHPALAALALFACTPPSDSQQAQPIEPTVIVRTDASYFDASVRERCAQRYPADMMMRAACKRNATSGKESFVEIQSRYADVPDMQASLAGCFERYTVDGVTDFQMIGACARNQERGYAEL